MEQPETMSQAPEGPPPCVYLIQTNSVVERQILEQWIADNDKSQGRAANHCEVIAIAYPKDDASVIPVELDRRLSRDDDPLLMPLRLAWIPKERHGTPTVTIPDLLLIGNPRRPRFYAQHLIAKRHPTRVKVLVGKSAHASALRATWEAQSPADPRPGIEFARFVVRRATLALEREESQLLGPQYKMPRLVQEEIRASSRFREGLKNFAESNGLPIDRIHREAEIALKELASGYTPLGTDFTMRMGRFFYRRGYDEKLDYDMEQVNKVRKALKGTPGVVLPSHRSNLDAGVMPNAFHELGLPKTSTFGGINMNFWPVGYFMRRSGVIYIRRDTKSDPLYRWVLREYIGYLVEKRFSLEWYIEGTRSRTGKSMPPKLGLLKYVIHAYRDGRTDDVALIPASMTYDQLDEVKEYVGEARGHVKKAENLGWFLRYFRSMQGRYGQIHVRFGDPISVQEQLGTPQQVAQLSENEYQLALQKLAFEVIWRINKVTPVTAISLITLAALSTFNRALTFEQLSLVIDSFLQFIERNHIPKTRSAERLSTGDGLRAELRSLIRMGVIHAEEDGPDPVFTIHREQFVAASFYRNTIIHHFLDAAIFEVSLASASKVEPTEAVDTFWDTAFKLRDVLKFDFFFLEKNHFKEALSRYAEQLDPHWEEELTKGQEAVYELIRRIQPLTADSVLRSYLEDYWVVAKSLLIKPELAVNNKSAFYKFCAGSARQFLLQRRIRSPETTSLLMFKPALELAQHRGLVETSGGDALKASREEFANEIRGLLNLIDEVYAVGRQVFVHRISTEVIPYD